MIKRWFLIFFSLLLLLLLPQKIEHHLKGLTLTLCHNSTRVIPASCASGFGDPWSRCITHLYHSYSPWAAYIQVTQVPRGWVGWRHHTSIHQTQKPLRYYSSNTKWSDCYRPPLKPCGFCLFPSSHT